MRLRTLFQEERLLKTFLKELNLNSLFNVFLKISEKFWKMSLPVPTIYQKLQIEETNKWNFTQSKNISLVC